MKALGLQSSRREVDKMIAEVDDDNSGEIEFPEFLTLMTKKLQEDRPIEFNDTMGTDSLDEVVMLPDDLTLEQITELD